MKTIYNLTQHVATPEQQAQGVVEVSGIDKEWLAEKLTFTSLPTAEDIADVVEQMSNLMASLDPDMSGDIKFMVGGAPYLMAALTEWAHVYDMVFAYTERVSKEVHQPDGTVVKTNVFKHMGFVPMRYTG